MRKEQKTRKKNNNVTVQFKLKRFVLAIIRKIVQPQPFSDSKNILLI
jgi:hypothetical protein